MRFKDPVPNKPWPGVVKDCTVYGPYCMQPNMNNDFNVSEDCLHLNVFTKNLAINGVIDQLKPVIVFVHGGGFLSGSAMEHDPIYMMERDVVLVTINYRLGVFGFAAVGMKDIPGNAGLKDQTLAFQWVQKNIVHFGGNPRNVTIAGLSAGGFSVTAHMVSPMSEGLFHNVIAMSGAQTWQKKLKRNNIDEVEALAVKVECPTSSVIKMVECLMNVSNSIKVHKITYSSIINSNRNPPKNLLQMRQLTFTIAST